MLTCDICKKEIKGRRDIRKKTSLPFEYACGAWQRREFDLCDRCEQILHAVVNQAECDFANGKYTESESAE